jgi:hypothetical protein
VISWEAGSARQLVFSSVDESGNEKDLEWVHGPPQLDKPS